MPSGPALPSISTKTSRPPQPPFPTPLSPSSFPASGLPSTIPSGFFPKTLSLPRPATPSGPALPSTWPKTPTFSPAAAQAQLRSRFPSSQPAARSGSPSPQLPGPAPPSPQPPARVRRRNSRHYRPPRPLAAAGQPERRRRAQTNDKSDTGWAGPSSGQSANALPSPAQAAREGKFCACVVVAERGKLQVPAAFAAGNRCRLRTNFLKTPRVLELWVRMGGRQRMSCFPCPSVCPSPCPGSA